MDPATGGVWVAAITAAAGWARALVLHRRISRMPSTPRIQSPRQGIIENGEILKLNALLAQIMADQTAVVGRVAAIENAQAMHFRQAREDAELLRELYNKLSSIQKAAP